MGCASSTPAPAAPATPVTKPSMVKDLKKAEEACCTWCAKEEKKLKKESTACCTWCSQEEEAVTPPTIGCYMCTCVCCPEKFNGDKTGRCTWCICEEIPQPKKTQYGYVNKKVQGPLKKTAPVPAKKAAQ